MRTSSYPTSPDTTLPEAALAARLAAAEARIAALEHELQTTTARAERRENQLTALLDGLPVGTVLVDPSGQIEAVNPRFRQIFGLAPDQTLAHTYAPYPPNTVSIGHHFRDPAAFAARARALYQAGQTTMGEVFRLADGRWVELDYLVLDALHAGRLICYRDVTEHRQRTEQVRLMSRIPQQNPYPILCLSPAGELLYANAPGALIAEALTAAAPAAWAEPLLALVQQALRTNQPAQQELALGEQYYLCAARPVPDEGYATVFLVDMTTRHQAEQLLAEQHLFFETILNQLKVAVAVVDPDYRLMYLNELAEPDPAARATAIGLTVEEHGQQRQRAPEVLQRRQRYLEQARRAGPVSWEETLPRAPGSAACWSTWLRCAAPRPSCATSLFRASKSRPASRPRSRWPASASSTKAFLTACPWRWWCSMPNNAFYLRIRPPCPTPSCGGGYRA